MVCTFNISLIFVIAMKKCLFIFVLFALLSIISLDVAAQCSICTKTAMQLGSKPAQGLNAGILYLMGIPYIALGIVGYKWWKSNKSIEGKES